MQADQMPFICQMGAMQLIWCDRGASSIISQAAIFRTRQHLDKQLQRRILPFIPSWKRMSVIDLRGLEGLLGGSRSNATDIPPARGFVQGLAARPIS